MRTLGGVFSGIIIIVIGSLGFVFGLEVIIKDRGSEYNKVNLFNPTKEKAKKIMEYISIQSKATEELVHYRLADHLKMYS